MATVGSIMHAAVVTAGPDETVANVAARMRLAGIGAILVVHGDALKAIFTERDLLNRVVAEGRDPKKTTVIEVSSLTPWTACASDRITACADLMRNSTFRHVPVVDDAGKPVGILSTRDFFEFVAGRLERSIDEAQYQAALRTDDPSADPYDHAGGSYSH